MKNSTKPHILLVDDDKAITASLALLLKQAGYRTSTASNPVDALFQLGKDNPSSRESPFSLVFQDMNYSRKTTGEEGLNLLRDIKKTYPQLPVILMTAWGTVELAVKGMKAGATDFVTKPWSHEQILHTVQNALELAEARQKSSEKAVPSRKELDKKYDFSGLVGEDPAFLEILGIIGRVSNTDASVLITGESGTGKELLAEAVWRNSDRKDRPFVKVNLGGIPVSLFESEMFGYVRGAFTGASHERTGRFETAHGGTIFLDEIGDLDAGNQVKLLRVLQDRTFEKLGSSRSKQVDVRIIAATNRNLNELIDKGTFREDLYYRLNLISVKTPPLRSRKGDIPLLANHFLGEISKHYKRDEMKFTRDALDWLFTEVWPGNVRQLKQAVERSVLLATNDNLSADDVKKAVSMESTPAPQSKTVGTGQTLEEMERERILAALGEFNGNISKTAAVLGISRNSLYRRLEKYGIQP